MRTLTRTWSPRHHTKMYSPVKIAQRACSHNKEDIKKVPMKAQRQYWQQSLPICFTLHCFCQVFFMTSQHRWSWPASRWIIGTTATQSYRASAGIDEGTDFSHYSCLYESACDLCKNKLQTNLSFACKSSSPAWRGNVYQGYLSIPWQSSCE